MGRKREPPRWMGSLVSSRWLPLPYMARVILRHWYVARRLGVPMRQVGIIVTSDDADEPTPDPPPTDRPLSS